MTINRNELQRYLTDLLKPWEVKDFCPNGLQVEGTDSIRKIITGVTASEALIDKAIEMNADAILVHHGYFWKGEHQPITGMKKTRIKKLIENDINLFAYHLPLDVHPELGNNVQLAKLLDIQNIEGLEQGPGPSIPLKGEFTNPISLDELTQRIESTLSRKPLVNSGGNFDIKTVAWCTGGGQSYIDLAAQQGIDCFITGEASEQTIHSSNEQRIHFIAAGHHATERYGAKSLGEHLTETFELDVQFIDINNPV
ncbi:Nif3-like dinuclear metal center hexameric protein [Flocculibacter collagenilyticus]|uniref:Nif3-like dinuclear metal center hexameric protein n=1 Tax=Flocculibacter collagenilyticus TaxID=2744479 RepID=UPI0018F4FD03|nr:Nif3-like dinuclear metal center hexameric protein [Flocculibacter collagenilyticus]